MSCGVLHTDNYFSTRSCWLDRYENEGSATELDRMTPPDHLHSNMAEPTMVTLEDLRSHYNSCYTCGVSWSENHVSLDCRECGGYSLERPCPRCDGKCCNSWRRDVSMSHNMGKAQWEGECGMSSRPHYMSKDVLVQGLANLSTSA